MNKDLSDSSFILHPSSFGSKGEMVGELRFLNVRAHQQPGDRLARQTPPGARPNMGAGLVPARYDSRVGRSIHRVTGGLDK